MSAIDFWYSIGSTYSYLTVSRLPAVAAAEGVTFRWRPFDVRHVMVAQNNIPFKDKPIKTAYMWRDIERRAEAYGLKPKIPAPYPLPGLVLANQVAIVGCEEGWVQDYTQATYRRWRPKWKRSAASAGLFAAVHGVIQTFLRGFGIPAIDARNCFSGSSHFGSS